MGKQESPINLDDLFAQTVSYEIAIASIMKALARAHPATAELVQKALAESRDIPKVRRHPKLVAKIQEYESVIETEKSKKFQ